MKILVLGGSGLVGSHVMRAAVSAGHVAIGTFRNNPEPGLIRVDLADSRGATEALSVHRPDWVIHAAGWTWVDGCERDPQRAFDENCAQPAQLAQLCHERAIRFAYVSSSYVFDGREGPYTEASPPNPINVYGKSKWRGEQAILEATSGNALIARVICVWGQESRRKNFLYQAIQSLRDGKTMRLPADQIGNPTWAGDIGAWLVELAARDFCGTWNLGGSRSGCTRIDWFCAIRDAARNLGLIPASASAGFEGCATSVLGQPALRPLHAGLIVDKIMGISTRIPAEPGRIDLLGTTI